MADEKNGSSSFDPSPHGVGRFDHIHLHRSRLRPLLVVPHRQPPPVAISQHVDRSAAPESRGTDDVGRRAWINADQVRADATQRADRVVGVVDVLDKVGERYAARRGVSGVTDLCRLADKTRVKMAEKPRIDSWFIGFAPVENPQIAWAVVVEESGYGSRTSAPIAGYICLRK